MRDLPRTRVVVNLERVVELGAPAGLVPQDGKRCDFLFVAEEDAAMVWAASLELKGGNLRASDVTAQLEGGADALDRLIPGSNPCTFAP